MGFGVTSACQFGRSDQSKTSHETILGKFKMLVLFSAGIGQHCSLPEVPIHTAVDGILIVICAHSFLIEPRPTQMIGHFIHHGVDQKPRAWTGCVAQRKGPAGPPPITATRALLLLRSILQSYKKKLTHQKLTDNNKYRFRVKMQKYFPVRYDIIPS